MNITRRAVVLEGVVCCVYEVGLCQRHRSHHGLFVGCDVTLDPKHESWVAHFDLEALMEFVCYVFEVVHVLPMFVAVVGVYYDIRAMTTWGFEYE